MIGSEARLQLLLILLLTTGLATILVSQTGRLSTHGQADSPRTTLNAPQFPIAPGSWNPHVSCTPWVVKISDITDNMTGSASLSNSLFSPGITSSVGDAKRWLASGATPPNWVSPGPPCTITNSHGQVAMFVEIDNIKFPSTREWEDCRTHYDPVNGGTAYFSNLAYKGCDSTANAYDPTIISDYDSSCKSPTDPTCYARIHTEIDGDWNVAGYAGPTNNDDNITLAQDQALGYPFDIQGYVYWDAGHVGDGWHSFSGWEIHPFTAWRVHKPIVPDFNITTSPANVTTPAGTPINSTISTTSYYGFSGSVSLTDTIPPGLSCGAITPGTITGSGTATISCHATASANYTLTITGTSGSLIHRSNITFTIQDFTINVNSPATIDVYVPFRPNITIAALNHFAGTVFLIDSIPSGISCGAITPVNITGSGTAGTSCTATVYGTYTMIVRGQSGTLSHNAQAIIQVMDFGVTGPAGPVVSPLGANATVTITLGSLNGYGGNVNLNGTAQPFQTGESGGGGGGGLRMIMASPQSQPLLSFSPTLIPLSSGQTNQSTLTIFLPTDLQPGSYLITVIASDGTITHSIQFTLTATDQAPTSPTAGPATDTSNSSTILVNILPPSQARLSGIIALLSLVSLLSIRRTTARRRPNSKNARRAESRGEFHDPRRTMTRSHSTIVGPLWTVVYVPEVMCG